MSIDLMWQCFLPPEFTRGVWMTLLITLCSLLYDVVLGLVLALLQEVSLRAGEGLAFSYLWPFRGTLVLLQIIFIYNVLPGSGLRFPVFTRAALALPFNEDAYMAEILHLGLQVVKNDQRTTGMTLGMTHGRIMRKIVLPQTAHIVLSLMGNQMVSMLKSNVLVSVIAAQGLLLATNQAVSASFRYFETFCAMGTYYLLLTSLLMIFRSWPERTPDPRQHRSRSQKRLTHLPELPKTVREEP